MNPAINAQHVHSQPPAAFLEGSEEAAQFAEHLEPGKGEFQGRSGAEWVLWRALRSRRPELFRDDCVSAPAGEGQAVFAN